jgi:hypothetical protein
VDKSVGSSRSKSRKKALRRDILVYAESLGSPLTH